MFTEEKSKKVLSSFYVSDFHLEMIIVPYIINKIDNNKKINIITKRDLEDSIRVLINKLNLDDERKESILKLNWKNEKIEELKNENGVYIVIGDKNFIDNKNNTIKGNNIEIVNCYNLEEVQDDIHDIKNNSDKI